VNTLSYRLLLVMVFTLPWENVVEIPGGGRISKLVGLAVAGVWVLAVLRSGRMREPHTVLVLAVLFGLWNASSIMWTNDASATQERVLTCVLLIGLLFVVWDNVDTVQRLHEALLVYLAGCYVTVGALLVGFLGGPGAAELHGRATVGSFHPNDVGMILALAVPIASYLLVEAWPGRWRVARMVAGGLFLPLSAAAVLATGSRAALGAMLPGVLYLLYLIGRRRPYLALGALTGLAATAVVAFTLAPPDAKARLSGTGQALQEGDLNYRQIVWSEAVRIIQEDPIFGTGAGAFRTAAVAVNKVGHNFVLSIAAELGLLGLALFLGMLVLSLLSLRHTSAALRWLWVSLFLSWTGAALLHNWEYRKQTWLFIALTVASGALQEAHRTRHRASQSRPAGAPT
jgi:O-antigen ligase